jgi:hypothetical protein
MMAVPTLIALSGPLKDRSFVVDDNGVRLSEDCLVRLCDGRAVAYSLREGQERPWSLLDHNARLEIEDSEFRLDHPEFDPDVVLGMFPDLEDAEIESFFLGLLMEKIERPIAAAVLLDNWKPGETAFGTYLPGFFHARYGIVNDTRRQFVPGVYDENERVFCARMSVEDRYDGAVYVKSLTPVSFRPEERAAIARIAAYVAIFLSTKDGMLRESRNDEGEDEKETRRISSPAELDIVFEEPPPAYHFGQNQERPSIEEVPSTLQTLLDDTVFGIFNSIEAAVEGAACLEIPGRPLHFIRRHRPEDCEIDKDVVYRAFTLDVEAARNANGTVWAVPIIRGERRLGVVYVKIDKNARLKGDLIEQLEDIASIAADQKFPENLDRFF